MRKLIAAIYYSDVQLGNLAINKESKLCFADGYAVKPVALADGKIDTSSSIYLAYIVHTGT